MKVWTYPAILQSEIVNGQSEGAAIIRLTIDTSNRQSSFVNHTEVRRMPQRPAQRNGQNRQGWTDLLQGLARDEAVLIQGGGPENIDKQHAKGRLTARERIAELIDPGTEFFELGLFAAFDMYREWGGAPSAGAITGIGQVEGRLFMIIANDATVKAGSFFPMTVKKVLRAQRVAMDNHLPLIYLVDSAGVFLPLQDEIFPDEDDFGRIFRNNARLSAAAVPQIAAIMGHCVAGGAYLPVMSDKILMTEGSGLYIAGPSL